MSQGYAKWGLPVETTDAWPGTSRLHLAQSGEPRLQMNFEAKANDVAGVRRISDRMIEGVAERFSVFTTPIFRCR